MINSTLKQNNYVVVKGFLNPQKAKNLATDFEKFCADNDVGCDEDVPSSHSVFNYVPFLELLCEQTSVVNELVGEKVLPSYCYARVYLKDADLKKHKDRDCCELSLTVHLKGDQSWDFWITTPDGKDVSIALDPGDAVIYHGCDATHWRNTYYGDSYTQVFLHYVYSKGNRMENFFSNTKYNHFETKKRSAEHMLKDYIMVIKDLVPHELCDHIVNQAPDDSPYWHKATVSRENLIDTTSRNCDTLSLSCLNEFKDIDNQLFVVAAEAIQTYHKKFSHVNCDTDTGYDLLRYKTGGFYVQHTDSFKQQQRSVTASLMLNDDYEGGEFAFFDRELKYKLNKGDVIMFPSNFMYPHEIMPVTSGTRYAIITWYV